ETAPENKLILASTNAQVSDLNSMVQEARRRAGELGLVSFEAGRHEFYLNDRVLFTKPGRLYGIENGDLATVLAHDALRGTMAVLLDDGRRVTVPVTKVGFQLGYCVTVHKAQGETVDRAYVFLYGEMTDAQSSYVSSSRARVQTRIYSTEDEAGPEMA